MVRFYIYFRSFVGVYGCTSSGASSGSAHHYADSVNLIERRPSRTADQTANGALPYQIPASRCGSRYGGTPRPNLLTRISRGAHRSGPFHKDRSSDRSKTVCVIKQVQVRRPQVYLKSDLSIHITESPNLPPCDGWFTGHEPM